VFHRFRRASTWFLLAANSGRRIAEIAQARADRYSD
jgi:hypothetical protein